MSVHHEGAELSEPGRPSLPAPQPGAGGKPYPARRSGGTIRRRVVRTLALPVATTLALLSMVTVSEVENYRVAADTARSVTIDLAVRGLIQELQTERGLTAGLLSGNGGFRAELAPAQQRVDEKRAAVEQLIDGGTEVEGRVAEALRQLDGLAGVRAGTATGSGVRSATFDFYTTRIAELSHIDLNLESSSDPELRRGIAALAALNDAKEATAQERAFLNGVFSASGFENGEFLQFVTMRSAKDAALTLFSEYATPTELAAKDFVLDTGAAREAAYFEQVALKSADGKYLQVNPQSWWSALTTVLDDMLLLEQHVGSVIQARAADLEDRATLRMGVLGGVVLICLAGSVYVATIASRSVATPLAALAGEANRLASEQLPEAVRRATTGDSTAAPPPVRVPRGASDEVVLVADAFDRVQATAYALATEQAVLRRTTAESLANLGRRNQNLLRRQLGFITKLEREESNPTGLANLFELDHLATRMRRNAESLLVLVGAASPRQLAAPLPVSDVIRAAVSEVEEYRRVALRRMDEALVLGSVVGGVAHMLAELIENGLAFSPPDMDVEIHGRLVGDRYLIAISDQGIGMSPAELSRANERLRGEGDFITAPARFLGHYVVGRLAMEMGIEVELTPSPVTGVTARISLPAEILAEQEAVTAAPEAVRPAARVVESSVGSSAPEALPLLSGVATATITAPAADRPLQSTAIEYVVVEETPVVSRDSAVALALESFAAADDGAARTANGLRKRTPRAHRAAAVPPAAASPSMSATAPPPVNDSPDAVRSRLTALRDGMRRGNTETAGLP